MSSVGGIKGGGGKKAGGATGAGGSGPVRKGGATFGKIDRTEKLVGPSGQVGSGNVQGAEPVLTARAAAIAGMLKTGELKSKREATEKFVADILKEKMKLANKSLSEKIAESLQDDPRLNQALDRLWSQG